MYAIYCGDVIQIFEVQILSGFSNSSKGLNGVIQYPFKLNKKKLFGTKHPNSTYVLFHLRVGLSLEEIRESKRDFETIQMRNSMPLTEEGCSASLSSLTLSNYLTSHPYITIYPLSFVADDGHGRQEGHPKI